MASYKPLTRYGIIGDLNTCALVGDDGSIDWCCLPHLESSSIFAAILDNEKGGCFSVRPEGPYSSRQDYIPKTNVLQTFFQTPTGSLTLTDFMPLYPSDIVDEYLHYAIYRKISCDEGVVDLSLLFQPRFGYAGTSTEIETTEQGIRASGGGEKVLLIAPDGLQTTDSEAGGLLSLIEGDEIWLALFYGGDAHAARDPYSAALDRTIQYWQTWVHTCSPQNCLFGGPWHDLIVRSSLVLRLLMHSGVGSICAAPTTSLPEEIGGIRNWDYRFNWIRDSSFTAQAFYYLGYYAEAKEHLEWFRSVCHKRIGAIRVLYSLHRELDTQERVLEHLSGYRASRPVRIGNAAAEQLQLDIFGELINAMYEITRYEEGISREDWETIRAIVDYVCEVWDLRDSGIWEMRCEPRHFVHSKLMCWVALDRGIRIAERGRFSAPLEKWREVMGDIRNVILDRGFSHRLNSFVQHFDSEDLDASALLIPILGLLPFDDPRVQGTIDAVMGNLLKNGLVYRYRIGDCLPGVEEGAFVLCTCWLVDVLALCGRVDEAEELFTGMMNRTSPLGLLAEEIDPVTGEHLGNFPQAFSHIGIINSALYLGEAKGRVPRGPEPIGVREYEKA